MKRNRDPLALSPHWHIDCRLVAELPEDTMIGTRFLVHTAFSAGALAAVLFTGYLGFVLVSLRHQIHDWEQRINDNRAEVVDIQRMQREYAVEAAKVDQAYALVRPQFNVSEFIANLGRSRPAQVALDLIEWNDAGIVVRGSLRDRSERASRLLGAYVERLRRDEKISPLFREIVLTDLDRGSSGETLKFEIKFSLKGST